MSRESKNKTILLVTPELEYTGALLAFKAQCVALLKEGESVEVLSYLDGPFKTEIENLGISVNIVDQGEITENFVSNIKWKYSLIIANTICTYKIANMAKSDIPVVWYIHEAENIPDFLYDKDCEKALRGASKIYCVSEYARNFIVKNYNQNVFVLHNFVDDVYCDYKDIINNKSDKIKLCTLGTIERRKGYDTLINSFLSLPPSIQDKFELHLAGRLWEGAKNFYPKILKKIKNRNNIFYHGEIRNRGEIYELITNSDCIVVPSIDESCSLVALEGAMLAKPLILSENIGAKYVLSKDSGWLFRTGDETSLKNAFELVLKNVDKLKTMGLASRRNYLSCSTWETYQKNIADVVKHHSCSNPIEYQIQTQNISFITFDVFDTLITRSVPSASSVFHLMQKEINSKKIFISLSEHLKNNFAQIRKDSELFLYEKICNKKKRDVTIEEIYDFIAKDHSLTKKECVELIQCELSIEKSLCYPIYENIYILKTLLKKGMQVALISDMYFSESQIRDILVDIDDVFNSIPIFVSSDFMVKKNTGHLFQRVKSCFLGVSYNKWLHIGDDQNGDYDQPNKLGIHAIQYPREKLKKYELIATLNREDDSYLQKSIGISRFLRFGNRNSPLYNLGVSLGGPILYPYINWLINESCSKGCKSLYFIARDGFVMKCIADSIIRNKNLKLQTHYLYGSRIAWRDTLLSNNKLKKSLLKKYLEQEINFNEKFVFVEFAGTGNTISSVVQLLMEEKQKTINFLGTYYFYQSTNPDLLCGDVHSWSRHSDSFSICSELLVRSLEGQTLGYYENDQGNIYPELDGKEGNALIKYGYSEYIHGVEAFAEAFNQIADESRTSSSSETILVNSYMTYLESQDVDIETISLLGDIPFLLDGNCSDTPTTYAPKLTYDQAKEISKGNVPSNKITCNLNWSVRRSSVDVQLILNKTYNQDNEKLIQDAIKISEDKLKKSLYYRAGKLLFCIPRHIKKFKKKYFK